MHMKGDAVAKVNAKKTTWYEATGAGSRKTPVEKLSLAAEVFVEHERFDEPWSVPTDAGLMVNRHVWPKRRMNPPKMIGRGSPGEDEDARGAYLSLASEKRGSDGYGGELPPAGRKDRRSRHAREWDYLAGHVERAYQQYLSARGQEMASIAFWSTKNLPLDAPMSEWDKACALARYALRWKMRQRVIHVGFHPVDVINHGSYCTGAACVLHALAMVAGMESRFIAITNHSMIELCVDGRWVWADNHANPGAMTPAAHNYAEVTADPSAIPYLLPAQRDYLSNRAARYRSPYHYAGRYYWHFCWGESRGRGVRTDVHDGYGLSVPYDPSTAAALYPGMVRHVFRVPKGWPAAVNLTEKGALVRAEVPIGRARSLRKRFYVGESVDNPVRGGTVKVWLAGRSSVRSVQCTLDGTPLGAARKGMHLGQPTADFTVPADLLTPGTHDLVFTSTSAATTFVLYPDPVTPYVKPVGGRALTVPDSAFRKEPVIGVKELEKLREEY